MACAIAVLTRSWSSFDIRRPALPVTGAAFGSSIVKTAFPACEETVVDNVVANAFGTPSVVRKRVFPALRSFKNQW